MLMDTDDDDNFSDAIYRERGISLQGLRSLYIYVDTPNARAGFHNLDYIVAYQGEEMERLLKETHSERMRAIKGAFPAIEAKIREAGIEIIPFEEGFHNPALPRLVVTMHLGKPKKNASFSAIMHLEQEVQLVRDPSVKFKLTTWETGLAKRKYKYNGIEWVLGQCLDSFLFFYRHVNPAQA